MKRYAERPKTAYEHTWMIRDAYGYHDFDDRESWEGRVLAKRFLTFLHGRAWTHAGCQRAGGFSPSSTDPSSVCASILVASARHHDPLTALPR